MLKIVALEKKNTDKISALSNYTDRIWFLRKGLGIFVDVIL